MKKLRHIRRVIRRLRWAVLLRGYQGKHPYLAHGKQENEPALFTTRHRARKYVRELAEHRITKGRVVKVFVTYDYTETR